MEVLVISILSNNKNKISCSKRLEFDAGHRVPSHEGKCKMLHGHRYGAEFTFVTDDLDQSGMVIDFAIIKSRLKRWIDHYWDHNIILDQCDKDLGNKISAITGQNVFYLPYHPTAENMALHLLHDVCPSLFDQVQCVKVKLYETPNSYAEVEIK